MSTFFFLACRANTDPGLAIAGLNQIASVALVCVSLLLGGVAVLLAALHSLGARVARLAGGPELPAIASERRL